MRLTLFVAFAATLLTIATETIAASGFTSYPSTNVTGSYSLEFQIPSSWTGSLIEYKNGGSPQTISSGLSTGTHEFAIGGRSDGTYRYVLDGEMMAGYPPYPMTMKLDEITVLVAVKPGTPSSISGISPTNDSGVFNLAWGASSGSVDKYEVYKETNGSWGSTPVYSGTGRSWTPPSALGDGTYKFRVRSCNTYSTLTSCSGYRTSAQSIVARKPGVPPNFSGVPSPDDDGIFTVTWGASSGSVDRYELYKETNGSWWATPVYSGAVRSWTPPSALGEGTYRFKVRACNKYSTYTSCSGYKTSSAVNVVYPPPDISFNVVDLSIGAGGVYEVGYDGIYSLAWAISGEHEKPTLKESNDGGSSWVALAIDGVVTLPFDKPGNFTESPQEYLYQLKACNGNACSVEEISVSILNYPRPGAPGNISLKNSATTNGEFTLRWGASSGPVFTHYTIKEKLSSVSLWGEEVKIGKVLEYPLSGKVSGKTYQYTIKTCNTDDACSGYVSPFSVYVPHPAPSIPGGLSVSEGPDESGKFTLTWSVSTGKIDDYRLEQRDGNNDWSEVGRPSNNSLDIKVNYSASYEFRVRACNSDNCSDYSETILQRVEVNSVLFLHTDILGSVIAESDESGELLQ